jgi:hypothetical protein
MSGRRTNMKLVLDSQQAYHVGHILAHDVRQYREGTVHRPSDSVYEEIIQPLWGQVLQYFDASGQKTTADMLIRCAYPEDEEYSE